MTLASGSSSYRYIVCLFSSFILCQHSQWKWLESYAVIYSRRMLNAACCCDRHWWLRSESVGGIYRCMVFRNVQPIAIAHNESTFLSYDCKSRIHSQCRTIIIGAVCIQRIHTIQVIILSLVWCSKFFCVEQHTHVHLRFRVYRSIELITRLNSLFSMKEVKQKQTRAVVLVQ